MTRRRPDPGRRIRAALQSLRRAGAVLANPDAHGYRERSNAWLLLALLLSAAAHVSLMSSIATMPRQYGDAFRVPLRARLAAAPPASPAQAAASTAAPEPVQGARPDAAPPSPATAATAARPPAVAEDPGTPVQLPQRYFPRGDLDQPAQALGRAPLVYPQGALHLRVKGTVRLRVFVSEEGVVDRVELVSVDPPGQHFEEAALDAVRLMRYSPARKDGQAVRSQKLVEVEFDPDERAPAGSAG